MKPIYSQEPSAASPDGRCFGADAFNVHASLVRMEASDPSLKDNPQWQIIRQDAYEALFLAMGS